MYRVAAVSPDQTPVIVIPGLFGSKLRNRTTGVEVWPGAWNRVLFDDYGDLELRFDPTTLEVRRDDLEAFDLAEVVLGKNFYGPIVNTLVNFGGYVRATPGTPVKAGERRYYVFPYDWRQDNVEQAKGLDQSDRRNPRRLRRSGICASTSSRTAWEDWSRATTCATARSTCSTACRR